MYNTKYKVKYKIIERELLDKLKNKQNDEKETEENLEEEYSEEDVLDICDKIYRDELLSVFSAENLEDLIIGETMNDVYGEIIKNPGFNDFISELEFTHFKEFIDDEKNKNRRKNLKQIILTSFFSQRAFHIIHRCICQQLDTGRIDDELISELRGTTYNFFDKEFVDLFEKEFT